MVADERFLSYPRKAVRAIDIGLIYDKLFQEHDTGDHPEKAKRLEVILKTLGDHGVRKFLRMIKPLPATDRELSRFHLLSYIYALEELAVKGGGQWDDETPVSRMSVVAARMAAGGAIEAVRTVMDSSLTKALALVRPPGHHAEISKAMGFCLFNNTAVAAHYALEHYKLSRILVVDWDVHHGNGTQQAFYCDDRVLFISLHQNPSFPGTGPIYESGAMEGEGFTINIPLPEGTGDGGYLYAAQEIILPIAREYRPQLVITSAGFDPHFADPLADMKMTVPGFARLASMIDGIAEGYGKGRHALILEGGYNLDVVGYAVLAVLNAVGRWGLTVNDPLEPPLDALTPELRTAVDAVKARVSRYWSLPASGPMSQVDGQR